MISALPVFSVAAVAVQADPTSEPTFGHSVIEDHGGTVVLPDAAHPPRKGSKILLDITSDAKAGDVIEGFDRAALILNQYAQVNVTPNSMKLAIILHGPATKATLLHEAYARHANPYSKDWGKTENPNLKLIGQLKQAGVEIFVCGQALAHQQYATEEVAPEVTIAVSAATVTVNLQMDGYAYIPFH